MLIRSVLAACAALACGAATASADSVVYIGDGGNVVVSQPDGSGKVQLTDGGGWHSPTQADDGTIAAVKGDGPITVMAKDGRVLREITTAPARSSNGGTFRGVPIDLSFSPDGTKIAYAYADSLCPPASSCGSQRSTFVTEAGVTTATPQETWGNEFGTSDPEWVTNSRLLVFGGAGRHANLDDIGPGDYNAKNWFNLGEDVGDGELSRDGSRLAFLSSYGADTRISFYAVSGDARSGEPPAAPEFACRGDEADAKYGDPSWSPDSSSIAFQSAAGVEVMTFTAFGPQSCAIASASKVIAPGASQPDWGPSEPATSRFAEAPKQVLPPAPKAPVSPVAAPKATPRGVPALTAKGATRQRFRGGISVGCAAVAAGTCEAVATVRVGKRVYRSKVARTKVKAGSPATLKVAFSRRATKAIRKGLRGRRLVATVTLRSGAATATHKVTLTR